MLFRSLEIVLNGFSYGSGSVLIVEVPELDQFVVGVKIRQSQELRGPKTLNPKEIGL